MELRPPVIIGTEGNMLWSVTIRSHIHQGFGDDENGNFTVTLGALLLDAASDDGEPLLLIDQLGMRIYK